MDPLNRFLESLDLLGKDVLDLIEHKRRPGKTRANRFWRAD